MERRIQASQPAAVEASPRAFASANEILWAVDGALTAGRSNRYRFGVAKKMTEFVAFLEGAAGTTATELEIRNNGTGVATLTIPAGQTEASTALNVQFNIGDDWTIAITSPGTGASGLQTISRFG